MGKIRKRHRTKKRPSPAPSTTTSEEPIKTSMEQALPLHIAENFEALTRLVRDDAIKGLKKIQRLPGVAHRLLRELMQIQHDQERIYIIGKRYLKVMDHLFDNTEDKNFIEIRYGTEYRQVKKLIREVEADLMDRYVIDAILKEDLRHATPARKSQAAKKASEPIPGTSGTRVLPPDEQVFPEPEIGPVELYNALIQRANMLIVDTRPAEEYKDSQILIDAGHMINIPEDIVVPGLSAHTLGQRLDAESQAIWDRRDSFDVMILMDWDTEQHNYSGSKLERLKQTIVEWDFNRNYRQEPVIMMGGFKEFMEWYPSEVTNSQIYLSQTNSEMDELLTIDDVAYPETGSGAATMNLKVHTVSSFGDIQARVARDFSDAETGTGLAARASRSEGQLPKDSYHRKARSAYRSLSEESFPREYLSAEAPEPISIPELGPEEEAEAENKSAEIKSAIEGDRAELLKEARALKPKIDPSIQPEVMLKNLIEESKDLFVPPVPPAVDRTFKPATVQKSLIGSGYTGIRNLHNNCFMSCVLQCLKVLPMIKSMFVTSNNYMQHIQRHPPVITLHFASVMKSLWEGSPKRHKIYFPQAFMDRIWDLNKTYARGNHEDTFEFFIFLFNILSDDCSFELPRPKIMTESEKSWYSQLQGRSSYFIDMTYYQMRNTKVCWNCQKPNYAFDNDSTLMLPIPELPENCNLPFMLADYVKENLVADYSCQDCRSTATIVNRKEFVVDPEILIIVLKRYVVNPDGTFSKSEAEIDFPADELMFGKSLYKLYAIPQHTGTMFMGHYYASCLLNDTKDTWVLYNDEKCTQYACPITEVPGIQSSCVGFFYVRQCRVKSDANASEAGPSGVSHPGRDPYGAGPSGVAHPGLDPYGLGRSEAGPSGAGPSGTGPSGPGRPTVYSSDGSS